LKIADRQGVEIDYCPQCRGVWLDRGELDKIIDRATPESFPAHRDRDDDDEHYRRHPRRRKSFLGELFDFD
jgi:Zn-finger nucleic acid-binding protein